MKEIEISGQPIKVVSTVEATGLFCPLPVVKLKLELEKVEPNQVVELLADDPGIVEDLSAWCEGTNNKLLSIKQNEKGIFVAYIEKQE